MLYIIILVQLQVPVEANKTSNSRGWEVTAVGRQQAECRQISHLAAEISYPVGAHNINTTYMLLQCIDHDNTH